MRSTPVGLVMRRVFGSWVTNGSVEREMTGRMKLAGMLEEELKTAVMSTAVAVIDALEELGFGQAEIGIRWPNDLECAG